MTRSNRPQVWHPRHDGIIEPPAAAEEVARIKQEYYAHYDIEALERRIKAFEELDLTDAELDVAGAIDHVLRSESGTLLLPTSWDELPAGTRLWRARAMGEDELRQGNIRKGDLWEPPHQFAGRGRLNQQGEPLLYTCVGDPFGTLTEARIEVAGAGFMLIAYEARESVVVRRVGVANADEELNSEHQAIEEKVSRFLAEVLSTPVEDAGRDTYGFTQKLLRELYGLEPGWESGWIYASTLKGPDLLNVALEPEDAHAKLKLWRVLGGRISELPDGQTGCELAGFSDGKPRLRLRGRIGFFDFPHEELGSLQAYFDYIEG